MLDVMISQVESIVNDLNNKKNNKKNIKSDALPNYNNSKKVLFLNNSFLY